MTRTSRSSYDRSRSRGQSRPRQAAPAPAVDITPIQSSPGHPPAETFAELNMPAPLLATLTELGVTTPLPIQGPTLPAALAGRAVLARGCTRSRRPPASRL